MTSGLNKNNAAVVAMVSDIVSAYVSNNHVRAAEVPGLIAAVSIAVSGLGSGSDVDAAAEARPEKPTPAQIRKSMSGDALISFIDGKPYQTLKRHLTAHGLTPDTYRAQFGLPSDYPMVTASYSDRRSNLAKSIGLGVKRGRRAEGAKVAPNSKGRAKAS